MKNRILTVVYVLLLAVIASTFLGCNADQQNETTSTTNISGRVSSDVTIQPDDIVHHIQGSMPGMDLDGLVERSDAILIGEVIEIRDAIWVDNWGIPPIVDTDGNVRRWIITDVIIQPETYLFGGSGSGKNIAIRTRGGRVGNEVMVSEGVPIFYLGDKVVLFLGLPKESNYTPVPDEIDKLDYYFITGVAVGKWDYENGVITRPHSDDKYTISDIENSIAALR